MNAPITPSLSQQIYDITGWGLDDPTIEWHATETVNAPQYTTDYLLAQLPPQTCIRKLKADLYFAGFESLGRLRCYAPTPANALGSFVLLLAEKGRLKVEAVA